MSVGLWPETEESLTPAEMWDENGVRVARPLSQYERNPIGFLTEILEIPENTLRWSLNGYDGHTWDATPDPLATIADALANWEDVGVESATGTGKSFTAAGLILWFIGSFKPARAFTFAPKEDQLRLYIWAEMSQLWPKFKRHFPTAEMGDLWISIDGSEHWGAWGYAVGVRAGEQVATKAAGMHSPHLLLVYEEMPGIPLPVIAAGENTVTAPHNLRLGLGNPDSQDDTLHQFCILPSVKHVRVSALDHPNVVLGNANIVPGAVAQKSIDKRREKYGEGSIMYESRVRGISPAQAADALVQREWCERAVARFGEFRARATTLKRAWGVDVANSEGGDKAAIARWQGACLLEVESFPCPDANRLGSQVVDEMRAARGLPAHVGIDSVGVGAGSVNEARRLGAWVQGLNGGARATGTMDEDYDFSDEDDAKKDRVRNDEKFANLRAQMWWQMREDLRLGRVALPSDNELIADLVTPRWLTKNGKIIVESKEDIKERLGRSPDKGDAAVYGNWVRDRSRDRTIPELDDFNPFGKNPELHQTAYQRTLKRDPVIRRKQEELIDPDFGTL